MKPTKLSTEALAALAEATFDGPVVRFPDQLDRKVYVEVNKALEALGGKWYRKLAGHVFSGVEAPERRIADLLSGQGYVNKKKELQQFFTPPAVADLLVKLADPKPGHAVLEPSVGQGAILRALRRFEGFTICASRFETYAVEIDPKNTEDLARNSETFPGTSIVTADFLTLSVVPKFNRVIMNPPFAKGQAIEHVLHAYKFLAPGGRLVSILDAGVTFRRDKKVVDFRRFVSNHSGLRSAIRRSSAEIAGLGATVHTPAAPDFLELPESTFAEAGTAVRTVVVVLEGPPAPETRP